MNRRSLRPPASASPFKNEGLSIIELLVTIVILGVLGAIGVSGVLAELRAARVDAAANELAGWLVAVRRSSERGIPCLVTIANSTAVQATTDVATGEAVVDDPLIPNDNIDNIPNICLSDTPLLFTSATVQGSSYSVVPSVASFIFTPRGSVCDADANAACTLAAADPIAITIRAVEGGTEVGNPRRVCVRPPLGLIDVAATC